MAAEYLSRLVADTKDKLVMKIREDVQTVPIEINIQSAGVSQEEQIFYTNDDDQTEEQYPARNEAIRNNPATEEPTVTIQTLSTNLVKQQPEIKIRLRKTTFSRNIYYRNCFSPFMRQLTSQAPWNFEDVTGDQAEVLLPEHGEIW